MSSSLFIRPETTADHAAIHQVVAAAFAREDEARLVDALRRLPTFRGELSLVAEREGCIVGHVLFTPIDIERDGQPVAAALALAPVAVHPDWQNRGIGAALVRAGLDACRASGDRLVIVLGHAEYYPRFGFEPARRLGIEAPFAVRDESWMACALAPCAADEFRGVVRYPAPFGDV